MKVKSYAELEQKEPKFVIGEQVNMPPNLYDETEGEILERERTYKRIGRDGKFERGGLLHIESHIDTITLPHTFDGETLTITYPEKDYGTFIQKERTVISKFYEWTYTVVSEEMSTMIAERHLTKK